jgi:hypothetical protein
VHREELKKAPYVSHAPSNGRVLFSYPYLDENNKTFKMWFPQNNELTYLFATPVESCYYAEGIVDVSTDIYVKMIDTIVRHYSFESLFGYLSSIVRDVLNCSVVVEKYFVFLERYRLKKDALSYGLIATELEYFFGNVRSLYDLLQKMIKDLWTKVTGNKLPDSFHTMTIKGTSLLRDKYGLPDPLITYYINTKDFFVKCCEIRNSIYHQGFSMNLIFCMDDGFALEKDSPLFPNSLVVEFDNIWPKSKIKQNGLVSVLALIAYINSRVLGNLDDFSNALTQSIVPSPPISERCRLFLRDPYVHHLLKSEEYMKKQWFQP